MYVSHCFYLSPFYPVCNVRWLGLRASHIRKYSNIGMCGDDLTTRDATILDGLQENNRMIRNDERYVEEIEEMRQLGKYELQWLYGHCDGAAFLEKFVLEAILHGDYL